MLVGNKGPQHRRYSPAPRRRRPSWGWSPELARKSLRSVCSAPPRCFFGGVAAPVLASRDLVPISQHDIPRPAFLTLASCQIHTGASKIDFLVKALHRKITASRLYTGLSPGSTPGPFPQRQAHEQSAPAQICHCYAPPHTESIKNDDSPMSHCLPHVLSMQKHP